MSSNGTNNTGKIWGLAAIAGIIAFFALKMLADYTFLSALLLAILIAILVAILLWIGFYRDVEDDSSLGLGSGTAGSASGTTASAAESAAPAAKIVSAPSAAAVKTAATPAAASAARPKAAAKPKAAVKPKAAAKQKAAAKAKPAAKPKAAAKPKVAAKTTKTASKTTTKAKPKPVAKAKSTSKTPAAKSTAAKSTAAKSTAASLMGEAGAAMVDAKKAERAKTATKPVAKDGKPPLLSKARAGGADDLKLIKGVGPGLEKTLNGLGFYHYDQVAGWRKAEIEWVDERLKFKGRIVRDDWVKQCKTLAKGGATEFSKRVKKGGVY